MSTALKKPPVDETGLDGPTEMTDPEVDLPPTKGPATPVAPRAKPRPQAVPVRPRTAPPAPVLPAAPIPLPTVVPPHSTGEEPLPTVTTPDGRKVVLLMPQYKSTCPMTLYSVAAVWDRATTGLAINYGDAFIIHSRNRLADRFVEENRFEWALFVDDDMVLPCGNAPWFRQITGWDGCPDSIAGANTIPRLLSAGKTVVGGLYFGRNHLGKGKPMYAEGFHNPAEAKEARNLKANRTVRPTAWVGTGCLLVHRSVFTDIRNRFSHLRPSDPKEPFRYFSPAPDGALSRIHAASKALEEGDVEKAKELLHQATGPESMVNAWAGEDVVFSSRCRAVGHQPHVDFGLVCGHVGASVWGPGNTAS